MALKKSQRSLKSWTKQKWRTKSGKKSSETGERYLPSAAIKALTPAEYAATSPVIPPPIVIKQSCLEKFLVNKTCKILPM